MNFLRGSGDGLPMRLLALMESRVGGCVSRLVGTGLMSVRVPYVRLVGGWEVHLCDAVDDRLLRLASWRRPGIPDSIPQR
jgi:hypothetical protein